MSKWCWPGRYFGHLSLLEEIISIDLEKDFFEIEKTLILRSSDRCDRSRLEDVELSFSYTPLYILRESEKMFNPRKNRPIHPSDSLRRRLFE